jgi:hypothetical protein
MRLRSEARRRGAALVEFAVIALVLYLLLASRWNWAARRTPSRCSLRQPTPGRANWPACLCLPG